jgi:hypothetical protein
MQKKFILSATDQEIADQQRRVQEAADNTRRAEQQTQRLTGRG